MSVCGRDDRRSSSGRRYRRMIRWFFRREVLVRHGDDMESTFLRIREMEFRRRGRLGVGVAWLGALMDGVRNGWLGEALPAGVVGRGGWHMSSIGTDFRFAVRALVQQPWSTTAIVVTLALGIGATTAVYAVFNYAVFRPVPGIGDPKSLVSVFVSEDHASRLRHVLTDAHLRAIRDMPAFEGLAGHFRSTFPFQAIASSAPESREVTRVTQGYFEILRVEMRLGRPFRQEEYEQPGSAIAVISERLWQSRYAGDPEVIGRDARILRHRFTIVGVARDFRGQDNIGREDVWVPLGAASLLTPGSAVVHREMVGRLAPGATLMVAREQAAEAVAATGAIRARDLDVTAVVFPGLTDGLGVTLGRLMRVHWTAMAGVSILFLLACVNAANLLVARNVRRRRTLALKAALGASRLRVLREMMVEAAVVAILTAAAGFAAGVAMTALFRSERLLSYGPTLEDLTVDWRVGVYATLAACTSVFLAAGLPSLLASGWHPQHGLRESAQGTSHSAGRLRDSFVVIQVALSIALVACTGVLAQTLVNLEAKDLSFDPDGLYEVYLSPRTIGYDAARSNQLFREVERRLLAAPGVEGATLGWSGHLGPNRQFTKLVTPSGETILDRVEIRDVSSSYLRTLGIPLVAGRMFTDQEEATAARVVVIDQSLASELFGGEPAVGQQIYQSENPREVIGVAADTGAGDLREEHQPALYVPARSRRAATVLVRSALPAFEAASSVRRVIREIEPSLPADSVVAVRDRIAEITAQERLLAKLGLVLAALALGIAVAGVYAAVSCRVTERTHEFGIRMAFGASRTTVGVDVLRRAVAMSGLGLVSGLALYAWGSRYIEARLYGVSSLDLMTLATATALILSSALVAAWLPAHRATKVDPMIAIRAE